jgi:hypothetical protein
MSCIVTPVAVVAEPPACARPHACDFTRALAQPCTPHARAPTWEVKGGPLVLFLSLALDHATVMRPCTPRRHGLAMEVCLVHAAAGEWGALLGMFRARLATDPCAHPHASVPDCGSLVRRHPLAPARAPPRPTPLRRFAANSGSKPEPITTPRPCTPQHARMHPRSHPTRPPDRVYRRRVDAAVPTMASTSPRWSPPSLFISFKP